MTVLRATPILVLLILVACGCQAAKPSAVHTVKGTIREISADRRTITIQHEEIPGYMSAMTMLFPVKSPELLDGFVPGEAVRFRLIVFPRDAYIDQIIAAQSFPNRSVEKKPSTPDSPDNQGELHLPQRGEPAPDFTLVNQDGRTVRLSDYNGRILVLNFVYTRCPLPTYCPRLMEEFKTAQKLLKNAMGREVAFLTITFDPRFDTPAVLKQYGSRYDADGASWRLLSGKPDEIRKVASFFNVAYWTSPQGTIEDHTLSAAVVDRTGKVARFYSGQRWSASDLVRDVQALLKEQPIPPGAGDAR